jgi:hypothetical protein
MHNSKFKVSTQIFCALKQQNWNCINAFNGTLSFHKNRVKVSLWVQEPLHVCMCRLLIKNKE